ncbi:MAG TPA: hypothetical protein VFI95_03935 [Terriglobales bacterium]|nr:hypothetical protein [Terriglobales bacterium]
MRGTLLLALLSVRSSYLRGIETAVDNADEVPDTLQWWFGDGGWWRIRTYALDHDIHAYQIANSLQTTLELAKKNNRDHYGDIIQSQHLIHFVDCANPAEVDAEFGRIGLVPRVEIVIAQFAFWKPDEAEYSTKSNPP